MHAAQTWLRPFVLASFFSLISLFSFLPQTLATTDDLGVTYIERSPRYYRYCVEYVNDLPQLCSGTASRKNWPDIGETVTYHGYMTTKGTGYSGPVTITWKKNGTVVFTETKAVTLTPGTNTEVSSYSMPWSATHESLELSFTVPSGDQHTVNNLLVIGTHDLTLSYWVETAFYNAFNQTTNQMGTQSFEDWMNWHIAQLNNRLSQQYAVYAPNGVPDRVRIDKFVVASELDGGSSPMATDPDKELVDGRWQTTDGDPTNTYGNQGFYASYTNQQALQTDWGLIHEVLHQLGAPDLYRLNLPNDPNNNMGMSIMSNLNYLITPEMLPNNGFPFSNPDIMGGGDAAPYNDVTYLSDHTAGGLTTNAGKRRGFYADYFFDTPKTTKIRVKDTFGNLVKNATVKLYQKSSVNESIDNVPEITVTTNTNGIATLPNLNTPTVTTVTGHTLRKNPFGQIQVSGVNGMMIAVVEKDNSQGTGYLLLTDLNKAFWAEGSNVTVTIPLDTNLYDTTVSDQDIVDNMLTSGNYATNNNCGSQWCYWIANASSSVAKSAGGRLTVQTQPTTGTYGACWYQWVSNLDESPVADGSTYRLRADFTSTYPGGGGFPTSFITIQTENHDNNVYWSTVGSTHLDETFVLSDEDPDSFVSVKFCSYGVNATQSATATLSNISMVKVP